MSFILLINIILSLIAVGLIWTIQLVHYPSMQFISMIFPPSYIFEAMREILINKIINYDLLKKIIILNFLYLSLSIIFFIKIINISREKGLLINQGE